MCVQGARWVQNEVMNKYADADLKTYIVWLPMIATDERSKWRASLLDDSRIQHFWNEDQAIGKWFTDNLKEYRALGPVAWDAYYLFDKTAKWDDAPAPVVAYGTPVFKKPKQLVEALEEMFGSTD